MKAIWISAMLALAASNAACAEDCGPLKIIGQADMISTQGALLVPASINGLKTKMIIDTGGWYRQLFPAGGIAAPAHLHRVQGKQALHLACPSGRCIARSARCRRAALNVGAYRPIGEKRRIRRD